MIPIKKWLIKLAKFLNGLLIFFFSIGLIGTLLESEDNIVGKEDLPQNEIKNDELSENIPFSNSLFSSGLLFSSCSKWDRYRFFR